MPDHISTSKCRQCECLVYWHTSKSGKKYPCNSEDRRDFHKCDNSAARPKQARQAPNPTAPLSTESIERRLQWLESEVRGLLIRMDSIGN